MATLTRLNEADLKLLRIFRVVVECGGFSPAEAELSISRPAISQHMADLELRLGMVLCQRGRAGFQLTTEGREVYQAVLRLMAAVENFRTEINALRNHLRGELNIGITDNLVTSPRMRVTKAVRALKMKGPDVRVNIRMIPPVQIERGVLDGQLHVGIIPAGRALPGLQALPLYDETWHLYCASEHPFFNRGDKTLDARTIATADAVAPAGLAGLPLRITATATDREGVAFLILTNCYIGFLPTHYARQWEDRKLMRAICPQDYVQYIDYQAVTLHAGMPNLILSTFMKFLEES